ncbi:DNA/RNA nuclease SfsA [Oribacterium sinus]|uniref:DNA/RNA nuclease SfsA n=1 Tax=Oribacterium sinus TaxID=237576 RepID=UPI0028E1B370|nr:DNA/RNA nuclease SfsA [Oribacterium sinus]
MQYQNIVEGKFLDRPNRFIAHVEIAGKVETVHVKNTGRCKELLLPGVKVYLERSGNPNRKTAYDLVAVEKAGLGLVNIDSQAPNQVVLEWLRAFSFEKLKPEYVFRDSRVDFYMERAMELPEAFWEYGEREERNGKEQQAENIRMQSQELLNVSGNRKYLLEVKGCTLERDGIGYFPDAPTERGVKHLRELTKALKEGYIAILVFVIAMPKVSMVYPNAETHKAFGDALEEARQAGVKILYLPCTVTKEGMWISS